MSAETILVVFDHYVPYFMKSRSLICAENFSGAQKIALGLRYTQEESL
jgi:hypothetical protein